MNTTTISVEDRLALQELTARYAFYVDTSQIEPLMNLWAGEGAVFDEDEIGTGYHAGIDAIRRFFVEEVFARMEGLAHLTTNFIVHEVTAGEARMTSTVLVEGDVRGGGTLHSTAYYDDVCERTESGWKFRTRKLHPFTKPRVGDFLAQAVAR